MNGLPQLPHAFSQRAEVQIPWWIALPLPSVGGTDNKLLSEGLVAALHPGRQVCPGGRPLCSDFGGAGGAEYPSSGNILDQTSGM